MRNEVIPDNNRDDWVDHNIAEYLKPGSSTSFFTFAGAGSGKTTSLIKAMRSISEERGAALRLRNQRVAVITYTNAACDEIKGRLGYDPLFAVSTIHSFLWELIRNQQRDIKEWVRGNLKKEIEELEEKQRTGRAGKASETRSEQIILKQKRIDTLHTIQRFQYNPTGENTSFDSLNHSEVIKMGPEFISTKALMSQILRSRFPIILIDESQDTNKDLVNALLGVIKEHGDELVIGMFCDTMQRVYFDGLEDLSRAIPSNWEKPEKKMNHRSSKRIVTLANAIRATLDGQEQIPRSNASEGLVRFFIAGSNSNKDHVEEEVLIRMAKLSGDDGWKQRGTVKILILEHHMAARRLGFLEFFTPLYSIGSFKNGVIDGTLPELSFVEPLVRLINALQLGDGFEVSKVLRRYSPLLKRENKSEVEYDPLARVKEVGEAVKKLQTIIEENEDISLNEVLLFIHDQGLLPLHERVESNLNDANEDLDGEKNLALREAFKVPLNQLQHYYTYVRDESPFSTQQGVKGLEFERVMVIMDDQEAKGFQFSYSKLFGTKEKTKADVDNEAEGKDTSILRTQRLFYVACTRAKESLALVAYTDNILGARDTLLKFGWFDEEEIIIIARGGDNQ
jgi:DNA helicase-2/ATP-dependent DNA helicase PcrA